MGRCELCGKRDRDYAHHCWDCGQAHWRDECRSAQFNDALRWCWCGHHEAALPPARWPHGEWRTTADEARR